MPSIMKSIFIIIVLLGLPGLTQSEELQIIDAQKAPAGVYPALYSCEGLGDINNDGYNDFLLGLWAVDELQLYLGGPAPFDNPPAIVWPNFGDPGGSRPFSPVNVGDVDCDGTNDFIAVFNYRDTLKLFLGMENLDPDDYLVMYADSLSRWNGFHISGGGDNNDDGRPDIWIAKSHYKDTLYGYSGCDLLDSIHDFRIIPSRDPDGQYPVLGREICTTCDLNGDSIPEVIYGQPANSHDYPGRVCIFWGGETLSETPDLIIYGPDLLDSIINYKFGSDLACLGDISGDGIDDLWISEGPFNFIYYGGQEFDTIPDVNLSWQYMYGNVENIGDINNDGYNDVMLVMDGSLFSYVSYIYCYPGMDTLVDAAFSNGAFHDAMHLGAINHVGYDHSWCGDINGDGLDDALITASDGGTGGFSQGWAIIQSGWEEPTAVDDDQPASLPTQLSLSQNHPNPFNPITQIEYSIPRGSHVKLEIFDILGRKVTTLVNKFQPAGEYKQDWLAKNQSSGIYFYKLTVGEATETKQMALLK